MQNLNLLNSYKIGEEILRQIFNISELFCHFIAAGLDLESSSLLQIRIQGEHFNADPDPNTGTLEQHVGKKCSQVLTCICETRMNQLGMAR